MMMTIMNGGLGGRGKNGREITKARTIDRREREANCSLHLPGMGKLFLKGNLVPVPVNFRGGTWEL